MPPRRFPETQRTLLVLLFGLTPGCVELPDQPTPAPQLEVTDAGSGLAWLLDAGPVRPDTAPPYTGPECEAETGGAGETAPAASSAPAEAHAGHTGDETASGASSGASGQVRSAIRAAEVVISELMPDPIGIDDTVGEWIELHSHATEELSLEGCSLDDGGSARAIAAPLRIGGGGYVVIARSDRAGVAADHVMSFSLANSADSVALACGGVEIDRVGYGDTSLRPRPGASLTLGADGVWCYGTLPYGENLGTPGAPNPPCQATSTDAGASADMDHDWDAGVASSP